MSYWVISFFSFSAENGISFSSVFSFTAENENAFSVGLYIKLFQITPYVNDFQTLINPCSGEPVGALKISFHPSFLTQVLTSFIIIVV